MVHIKMSPVVKTMDSNIIGLELNSRTTGAGVAVEDVGI